jgi:hypothetical protein
VKSSSSGSIPSQQFDKSDITNADTEYFTTLSIDEDCWRFFGLYLDYNGSGNRTLSSIQQYGISSGSLWAHRRSSVDSQLHCPNALSMAIQSPQYRISLGDRILRGDLEIELLRTYRNYRGIIQRGNP